MKFILIVLFMSSNGVHSQRVEGLTEMECRAMQAQWQRVSDAKDRVRGGWENGLVIHSTCSRREGR